MAANKDARITATAPVRNIFLRPYISARRPKISTNMALAIKKAVGIQLRSRAESDKSSAMAGSATFTDDSMIGTDIAFNKTMTSTYFCSTV